MCFNVQSSIYLQVLSNCNGTRPFDYKPTYFRWRPGSDWLVHIRVQPCPGD